MDYLIGHWGSHVVRSSVFFTKSVVSLLEGEVLEVSGISLFEAEVLGVPGFLETIFGDDFKYRLPLPARLIKQTPSKFCSLAIDNELFSCDCKYCT